MSEFRCDCFLLYMDEREWLRQGRRQRAEARRAGRDRERSERFCPHLAEVEPNTAKIPELSLPRYQESGDHLGSIMSEAFTT